MTDQNIKKFLCIYTSRQQLFKRGLLCRWLAQTSEGTLEVEVSPNKDWSMFKVNKAIFCTLI